METKIIKGSAPFIAQGGRRAGQTITPIDVEVTEELLKEIVEIVIQEGDFSGYDEYLENEYRIELDYNFDMQKVIDHFEKKNYWNDFTDCETKDEFEERLQSYIEDDILDIAPRLPSVEYDSGQQSNHYNPCEGCGGEDCCCCEVGRGW